MNRNWFLAMYCAKTIGSSIAAADDNYALAGGENVVLRWESISVAALILLREKFHRVVDSFQFTARYFEIARMFGPAGQHEGVEVAAQLFHRNVLADFAARYELHPLPCHLFQAPADDVLLHL